MEKLKANPRQISIALKAINEGLYKDAQDFINNHHIFDFSELLQIETAVQGFKQALEEGKTVKSIGQQPNFGLSHDNGKFYFYWITIYEKVLLSYSELTEIISTFSNILVIE